MKEVFIGNNIEDFEDYMKEAVINKKEEKEKLKKWKQKRKKLKKAQLRQ